MWRLLGTVFLSCVLLASLLRDAHPLLRTLPVVGAASLSQRVGIAIFAGFMLWAISRGRGERARSILNRVKGSSWKLAFGGPLAILCLATVILLQGWSSSRALPARVDPFSTRYVGPAPQNLVTISDVVARATKSLRILCDFPAYAGFGAARVFPRYERALMHALDVVKPGTGGASATGQAQPAIQLVTYRPSLRLAALEHNYPRSGSLLELKKTPIYEDYIWLEGTPKEPATWDDFYGLVEADNVALLDRIRARAAGAVCETSESLPLYVWIRDDEEAVFSLYVPRGDEVSFVTTDEKLVAILVEMHEEIDQRCRATSR